jgi:mannosyltransferase
VVWYTLAAALLGYLHLYALLLLVPHALHALLVSRDALRRLMLAWIAAGALVAPLMLVAAGQRDRQLFWLDPPELVELPKLALLVGGTTPAVVALGVMIMAGTWWLRDRPIVVLWAVVPVVVSFAVSQGYPIFTDRYVLFVVPAFALLAGVGIDGAARLMPSPAGAAGTRTVSILVIAGLALPAQLDSRRPDSRPDDLRTMSRELSAAQRPGDAVMPVPARAVKFMNAYGGPFDGRRLVRPGGPERRNPARTWVVTIGPPAIDRHPELAELDLLFDRTSVRSYGMIRVSLWVRRATAT